MIRTIKIPHQIRSLRDFEAYISDAGLAVATNREAPAELLLSLTRPRWECNPQGCLLMYQQVVITKKDDPRSPVGKRMVPSRRKPVLSRFFVNTCLEFSFDLYYDEGIPADMMVLVKDLERT